MPTIIFVDGVTERVFYIDASGRLQFVTLASLVPSITVDWSQLTGIPGTFIKNGAAYASITSSDISSVDGATLLPGTVSRLALAAPPGTADYSYLIYRATSNQWTINVLSNIAPSQLQAGSDYQVLRSLTGAAAWSQLSGDSLFDLAVTTAKLDDAAVTNAKLGANAVSTSKIADL